MSWRILFKFTFEVFFFTTKGGRCKLITDQRNSWGVPVACTEKCATKSFSLAIPTTTSLQSIIRKTTHTVLAVKIKLIMPH